MSTFDENGIVVDSKLEIVDKLSQRIKGVWGNDHRTDKDSVTGDVIDIFSEIFEEQNLLILDVSTIYRPDQAFGVWLSEIVKLNDIERKEPSRTTVAVECFCDTSVGTTVFSGDLVDTESGVGPFQCDNTTVIAGNDSAVISFTAVNVGNIIVDAGDISVIKTPRRGWSRCENPAEGVPGNVEESDSALKDRRRLSASAVGNSSLSRMYDLLLDLENVTQVNVDENNLDVDNSYGMPPQHVRAIVQGGNDSDIANIIYKTKGGGTGTFGAQTFVYNDLVRGLSWSVNYDRPTDVTLDIEVTTDKLSNYPTSGDLLIKEAVAKFINEENIRIGGTVYRDDIRDAARTVEGHKVQTVKISINPAAPVNADLELDIDQRAVTAEANVSIVEAT